MSERLPALTALRCFVAVARHRGVSRAAQALHLTHSAVSHQLRQLQEQLGVTLLERDGRGVRLTGAGAVYAERIGRAFDEMEAATLALAVAARTRPLRVSTMPSFAARWLMPRLGDFISAHPGLDIEVQSTTRLADIKAGEVDVALRFGAGRYPGLHSELLMRDWYFPVCSPQFARRHRLREPPRLEGVPLLRSDNEPWSWWFSAAGLDAAEPERGTVFDDSSLMLQAAMAGQGLCLGRHSIASDDLVAKRLVRPFRAVVESPNAYYFVCREGDVGAPAVAAFRAWIGAQAAAFPALVPA